MSTRVEPRKLIQLSSLAIARDEGFFVVQNSNEFFRGIVVFAHKRGEGAPISMKSARQRLIRSKWDYSCSIISNQYRRELHEF
ncbi:hypothetical protein BFZC1_06633 [Lysinibacillus fusiformis ZC1]|nr:hypothetical protein BFZC1_06633 [Lysinibacillus fusiformis ZC1]